MPASTAVVTVTGKTGPGLTDTSQVLRNVTNINFNIAASTVRVDYSDASGPHFVELDLYSIATVTYSVSSHVATVAVST